MLFYDIWLFCVSITACDCYSATLPARTRCSWAWCKVQVEIFFWSCRVIKSGGRFGHWECLDTFERIVAFLFLFWRTVPLLKFSPLPFELRSRSPCPGSAGRKALDLCQRWPPRVETHSTTIHDCGRSFETSIQRPVVQDGNKVCNKVCNKTARLQPFPPCDISRWGQFEPESRRSWKFKPLESEAFDLDGNLGSNPVVVVDLIFHCTTPPLY